MRADGDKEHVCPASDASPVDVFASHAPAAKDIQLSQEVWRSDARATKAPASACPWRVVKGAQVERSAWHEYLAARDADRSMGVDRGNRSVPRIRRPAPQVNARLCVAFE